MANKTKFTWIAPTENTDGTLIDYSLAYELGVQDAQDELQAISVFPGTLNPDGNYSALLSEFPVFNDFKQYTISLRSINTVNSASSDWAASISFTLSAEVPKPPLALAAE
jgi:hypothetical protein